jgi:hypothetical protein
MGYAEEIIYLDDARAGAARRLEECEREIRLTRDLDDRGGDDEVARRRRKLQKQTERYRELIVRLADDAKQARRSRLAALEEAEVPHLVSTAARLHQRARRLQDAQDKARDRYRGLRMRHLALDREVRELSKVLGLPEPEPQEPEEIRVDLGRFHTDGED